MIKLKKSLTTSGILVTALVLALLLYVASKVLANGKKNPQANLDPLQIQEIILSELQQSGYVYPYSQYWVYVSKMETAGWTSDLFKTRLNLWGMRTPQTRFTTATNKGSRDIWANYESVRSAAKDIVLYMDALNYPKRVGSLQELIQIMKEKGYYGDEDFGSYYTKVVSWINK